MRRAMKPTEYLHHATAACAVLLALATGATADDTLKVASRQHDAWESSAPELGQQAGIFKKHGIVLEFADIQGNEAIEQHVISGSLDIGLDIDIMDVLRAYGRGAPLRIIGANVTGATNYWYVLKVSPIQTVKDLVGRTIAYASNGSLSHYNLLDFIKQFGVKAKPVPTGGATATLKAIEAKQVDVGWAAPPFGIDAIEQDKIRVIARANDVSRVRGMTVSVLITNAAALERRKDVLTRFMQAYRETIDWMYSDPAALKQYAEQAGMSERSAQQLRDRFITKEMLSPDKIAGLKTTTRDAGVRLSGRQVSELIQIPPSTQEKRGWFRWRSQ
jgi:NitT/TauT family transport system substrate-binding protein